MEWLTNGPSPFLVIWHFFLLFAGVVLATHVFAFIVSLGFKAYTHWLVKHHSGSAK